MDKSPLVVDIPFNEVMKGIGQERLQSKGGSITLREIWNQRDSLSNKMVSQIEAVMEVFQEISLEGLLDLRKRYNEGSLTQDEELRIAAMKVAMYAMEAPTQVM